MPSLAEIREEIAEKSAELHRIFAEAGDEMDLEKVSYISGDTAYKASEIRRRNDELTKLGQEKDRLEVLEQIGRNNAAEQRRLNEPAGAMTHGAAGGGDGFINTFQPRDLKRTLQNHKGYKAFQNDSLRSVSIELPTYWNTLVTLTTINTQATRQATVQPMPLEERTTMDLMLQGNVDNNTIEYYEETTVTNNADTVAEGDSKPESALAWTLRTEHVRKIATWIPATKEALDDVSYLESTIRGRLAYMVQRIEEAQVLTGDGNAPNLLGILSRGIQSQAKGGDPTPDAIYKGMQKVRGSAGTGFAEPTAIVMHPNDWTDIKLLRTTEGIYLWGNPSDEGPDRIWGLTVRQTTAMTENTALVGAFRPYSEVLRREGITITLSTEHSTYFVENKVAILAESRLGLAVYRPSAFCEVTGI